jgi:hypothetical protein
MADAAPDVPWRHLRCFTSGGAEIERGWYFTAPKTRLPVGLQPGGGGERQRRAMMRMPRMPIHTKLLSN